VQGVEDAPCEEYDGDAASNKSQQSEIGTALLRRD
jgi:hypothetical protein